MSADRSIYGIFMILLAIASIGLGMLSCDDSGTSPRSDSDGGGNGGDYDPPDITENSYTGSLNTARNQHTATLLDDGRVLVTGGFDGTEKLASCELYNPETGKWSLTASMSEERVLHTAILMDDGRVWVTGGSDSDNHSVIWFELFDPVSETWSEVNYEYWKNDDPTTRMETARLAHCATLMESGKVLVSGGYVSGSSIYSRTFEFYDPDSNVCKADGSHSIYMHDRRYCHTSTLLEDGRVFVVGGYNDTDGYIGACEIFDPAQGTWTETAPMSTGTMWHTADLLDDGRVLISSGKNSVSTFTNTCRIYNPSGNSWSATGSMRELRNRVVTTKLPDGRIFAAGNLFTKTAEIYDTDTGT